jgi:hypothetical protein
MYSIALPYVEEDNSLKDINVTWPSMIPMVHGDYHQSDLKVE